MVQSKIFIHIIDLDGNQFQWETHQRTFQIQRGDSFDDCRKSLIAKLSSKQEFREKYRAINNCLKCNHKLKVFVNKRLTNKDSKDVISKMLSNFRISSTQFALYDNIHNTIQKLIPTKAKKSCAECIYFIESETNISPFNRLAKTNNFQINTKSEKISTKIMKSSNANQAMNYHQITTDKAIFIKKESLTKSKTVSKQTRTRSRTRTRTRTVTKKRTRTDFEQSPAKAKSKQCNKKPKIERLCKNKEAVSSNPECIWILIDMAQTMSTNVLNFGTKCRVARDLIQIMVETNWKKAECKANHFRLFSFARNINDLTNKPYIGYSAPLSKILMKKLHEIEYESYERCMSHKQALNGLIDIIAASKKMEYGLDNNRILLFTDAERSKCGSVQHLDLKNKLRRNKIVLDCIHITKSKRAHGKLKELCEDGDMGKYFNPINKTKGNYDAIMHGGIMTDVSLRNAANAVIELD